MGADARLATEGPAGVLYSTSRSPRDAPGAQKRSRCAQIRRRSKSFMNNPG
jgi:hypothetical protein